MTKKLLATSLFAACFATTALTSSYTFAKDADIYFYPKNKWVVEQINAADTDKLKICTVSNQLNNGYIVQITGNADGFTNMNIDFRQDIFESSFGYVVNYSVPGIIESTPPTKAFKKNILVSDLREESEFTNSLRNASVLDVQISNTSFRMYLTGFASAMNKYKECVQPVTLEPENTREELAAKIIAETIAKTTSGSEEGIAVEIETIEIENVAVAPPPPQIDLLSDIKNEGAPQDITTMSEHDLRPSPSSRPRYTEILAKKLKEESLKYRPEIVENTMQANEAIEPEASSLSVTNDLKEKLSNNDITAIIIEEKNIEEVPSFEVAIAYEDMPVTAEILASIEPAAGQEKGDNDFVDMRDKLSELENRVSVLLSKNKMLDEELKAILQDSENERLSVSSSNWDLERATMKFNEAERQIMRLGRKLQTQKAQCQFEKVELENMLFDPELTNQNQLANLALLEEEVESVKSDLYRQQRQYEERIRLLEQQLEAQ